MSSERNCTEKYLLPCLNLYTDKDLVSLLCKVSIEKAFSFLNNNIDDLNTIYLLIDPFTPVNPPRDYIALAENLIGGYNVIQSVHSKRILHEITTFEEFKLLNVVNSSNGVSSSKFILGLSLPIQLPDIKVNFLSGNYSKMYSDTRFIRDTYTQSVLQMDSSIRKDFIRKVNYKFKSSVTESEFPKELELDFPPDIIYETLTFLTNE